jgi:hypothetical protein
MAALGLRQLKQTLAPDSGRSGKSLAAQLYTKVVLEERADVFRQHIPMETIAGLSPDARLYVVTSLGIMGIPSRVQIVVIAEPASGLNTAVATGIPGTSGNVDDKVLSAAVLEMIAAH